MRKTRIMATFLFLIVPLGILSSNTALPGLFLIEQSGFQIISQLKNSESRTIQESFDTTDYLNASQTTCINWGLGNISNAKDSIRVISQLSVGSELLDFQLSGNLLFLAAGSEGTRVANSSAVGGPSLLGIASDGDGGSSRTLGIQNNRLYVAEDGDFEIYDISDAENPILIGEVASCLQDPRDLFLDGNMTYIADYKLGLVVINNTNPFHPNVVGSYSMGGNSTKLEVSGDIVYLANRRNGLEIVNVSVPSAPTKISHYNNSDDVISLDIIGSQGILLCNETKLKKIDLQNVSNPVFFTESDLLFNATDLSVDGNLIFLATRENGTRVYDWKDNQPLDLYTEFQSDENVTAVRANMPLCYIINNQSKWQTLQMAQYYGQPEIDPGYEYSWNNASFRLQSVEEYGDLVALATDQDELIFYNISNPSIQPVQVGYYHFGIYGIHQASPSSIFIQGNIAFVTLTYSNYEGWLASLDLSNLTQIEVINYTQMPYFARKVIIGGDYAFVCGWDDLYIYDVSNPGSIEYVRTFFDDSIGSIDVEGDVLVLTRGSFAATQPDTIHIYNISDIENWQIQNVYSPNYLDGAIALSGPFLYGTIDGFSILNISDPSNPNLVGKCSCSAYGSSARIRITGNQAIISGQSGREVSIIDIRNPNQPKEVVNLGDNQQILDCISRDEYLFVFLFWSSSVNYDIRAFKYLEFANNTFQIISKAESKPIYQSTAIAYQAQCTVIAQISGAESEIIIELSADNGSTWQTYNNASLTRFSKPGTIIKWRVELTTGIMDEITILDIHFDIYNDTIAPTIQITSPVGANNSIITRPDYFTLSISESESQIDEVYWMDNITAFQNTTFFTPYRIFIGHYNRSSYIFTVFANDTQGNGAFLYLNVTFQAIESPDEPTSPGEDMLPMLIGIFASIGGVVVVGVVVITRRRTRREVEPFSSLDTMNIKRADPEEVMKARIDTLQKIIEVYDEISLDEMAKYLKYSDKIQLGMWIIEMSDQFPLELDGETVRIVRGTIEGEIDDLLSKYQEWEKDKTGKGGKKI